MSCTVKSIRIDSCAIYAMEGPYIVAVLVGVLAHVHLLCLDGRIAVGRRIFWGGTAVKVILLVLHGCMYALRVSRSAGVGD
jgi:hypothetical protein